MIAKIPNRRAASSQALSQHANSTAGKRASHAAHAAHRKQAVASQRVLEHRAAQASEMAHAASSRARGWTTPEVHQAAARAHQAAAEAHYHSNNARAANEHRSAAAQHTATAAQHGGGSGHAPQVGHAASPGHNQEQPKVYMQGKKGGTYYLSSTGQKVYGKKG